MTADGPNTFPNAQVHQQTMDAMCTALLVVGPRNASLLRDSRQKLIDALGTYPMYWVRWLKNPNHANGAESMATALPDDARDPLRAHHANRELLSVLQAIDQDRATARSVSLALARQSTEVGNRKPTLIDLRATVDSKSTAVSQKVT